MGAFVAAGGRFLCPQKLNRSLLENLYRVAIQIYPATDLRVPLLAGPPDASSSGPRFIIRRHPPLFVQTQKISVGFWIMARKYLANQG